MITYKMIMISISIFNLNPVLKKLFYQRESEKNMSNFLTFRLIKVIYRKEENYHRITSVFIYKSEIVRNMRNMSKNSDYLND